MKAIFQQFDTDNSGFITKENIRYAMQKLGQELPAEEIDEILEEHDVTGDGKLSFDEFMRIFVSDTIWGIWFANKVWESIRNLIWNAAFDENKKRNQPKQVLKPTQVSDIKPLNHC